MCVQATLSLLTSTSICSSDSTWSFMPFSVALVVTKSLACCIALTVRSRWRHIDNFLRFIAVERKHIVGALAVGYDAVGNDVIIDPPDWATQSVTAIDR